MRICVSLRVNCVKKFAKKLSVNVWFKQEEVRRLESITLLGDLQFASSVTGFLVVFCARHVLNTGFVSARRWRNVLTSVL